MNTITIPYILADHFSQSDHPIGLVQLVLVLAFVAFLVWGITFLIGKVCRTGDAPPSRFVQYVIYGIWILYAICAIFFILAAFGFNPLDYDLPLPHRG